MQQVRDIVYRAAGMTVAFDDGSVAQAVYQVRDGLMRLVGLSDAQAAALKAFNNAQVSTSAIDPRLPPATVSEIMDISLNTNTNANGQEAFYVGSTDITRFLCAGNGYLQDARFVFAPSNGFPNGMTLTIHVKVGGVEVWTLPMAGNGDTSLRVHTKTWGPGEVPVQVGTLVIPTVDLVNKVARVWGSLQLTFVYEV